MEPGSTEDEEQIWGHLGLPLRMIHVLDEGLLLHPGRTYPLSSGFGYAISARTNPDQIGAVARFWRFDFLVC